MENQLTTINDAKLIFDPQNLTKKTIKKYLCPEASDQELTMGLQIAKTYGLNPLKREVYFVKYKAEQPMQVLVGYEVYLKRAERSGKYNGLEITSQGSIKDGNLKAIVKVFRKDWDHPLVHEAHYSEYVQMKKDFKTGVETPNKFWASKPITMIKKVAVSQSFRMAFPDEFDGMPYTSDEVVDQEHIIDVDTAPQNAVKTPVNAPGSVETKKMDTSTSDAEFISKEQVESLMMILARNGHFMKDLKEYIMFEFDLDSPLKITNGMLPQIKAFFSDKVVVAK